MDVGRAQIARAKAEAADIAPQARIDWVTGNAARPADFVQGPFEAIFSFGNSIPLLGSREVIGEAFRAAKSLLSPGGSLIISLRDHEKLRTEKPHVTANGVLQDAARKGTWLETAEWSADGQSYVSHIIFVMHEPAREVVHFPFPPLAALSRQETLDLLSLAGFRDAAYHEDRYRPAIGFPVFTARKESD